ncbi:MAG TPA: FAD-dependent oxidoreductase [Desulfotomaculum sp.]|nr:MAG: pyridine nucleotide-disulfide oxidoreductase [Desulfotomaculum sp. BICA1-6]HBX22545.1 FAD-dependent oxidoreductase [Desulfotomaculum sp.]
MAEQKKCQVSQSANIISEFLKAGDHCDFCGRHLKEILHLLNSVRAGDAQTDALDVLRKMALKVINLCRCGRGKMVAQEFSFAMQAHRDDFLVHLENKVCPAGQCPKLVPAPCQAACPAGIDIPNYVTLVGLGRYQEALALIREDVALPGALGRVCEHPCEKVCRRGQVDRPISICALKRLTYDRGEECSGGALVPPERKYEERVAVVGAGPAGLSAAYFLARRGYGVTVFEAMPEAGGMLAYGIPTYRLPREVLRAEVDYIKAMGVKIKLNTPVAGEQGPGVLIKDGYAAVFLGTGAWQGAIPLPKAQHYDNVLDGVTFLRQVNQELLNGSAGHAPDLSGKKVVVVGGGNVAIDAARVALRLGAAGVKIVYRRTREEMPALSEEIVDAEKEGVEFDFLVNPTSIGSSEGIATQLQCLRNTLSDPDASGRRKPVPLKHSEFKLDAQLFIFATGQQPDLAYLGLETQNYNVNAAGGRIVVDSLTMETSVPGIYAGGDAVTGPATVIKAVAAGKRAAAAIDDLLRGRAPSPGLAYPVKRSPGPLLQSHASDRARDSLIDGHALYIKERKNTFDEALRAISDEEALAEAARCLRCDMCIACGKCMDTCRDSVGSDAIRLGYLEQSGEKEKETDFMRPQERCMGCGACAANCPTGAITVEDKHGFRETSMCGGLMSRLELATCQECGQQFATTRHLGVVNDSVRGKFGADGHNKEVCSECAARVWSLNIFG